MAKRYDISEYGPKSAAQLLQCDGYEVAQWCTSPDGSGRPVAVVLSFVPGDAVKMSLRGQPMTSIGLRLKSRHAINTLISILEHHRDEVFPIE